MSLFITEQIDYEREIIDEKNYLILKNEKFESFNESVLGLGLISETSNVMSAICAIFDLEGFTNFCKQTDPQLSVPVFLSEYLKWIFNEIKQETMHKHGLNGYALWHDLPILIKFMGDGLLVIWNTKNIDEIYQRNIIHSMNNITMKYIKTFLPKIKRMVSDPPSALRCGISKGNIYSVGNGNDFVGPCINLASRLQKLPYLTFSFSARGFNIENGWKEGVKKDWLSKTFNIRGMANQELIYIKKDEFDKIPEDEKVIFGEI